MFVWVGWLLLKDIPRISCSSYSLADFQITSDYLISCFPKFSPGKGSGVILGQNCVQLSEATTSCFLFQKFVLYQKHCKYTMNHGLICINIGSSNQTCPFIAFFREKVLLYISAGFCIQFLKPFLNHYSLLFCKFSCIYHSILVKS